MKKPDKLYKYRSLRHLCLIRDILENGRLWASDFEELNDPMEGVFHYGIGDFSKGRIQQLFDEKKKTRVCSLSRSPENELMWTFYADNHRGIVIEVELDVSESAKLEKVKYIKHSDFKEQDGDHIDAKYLLKRKLPAWKYENEWRVLTDSEFVSIRVTGIILGVETESINRLKMEDLVAKYNPSIKLKDRSPVWLGPKSKSAK